MRSTTGRLPLSALQELLFFQKQFDRPSAVITNGDIAFRLTIIRNSSSIGRESEVMLNDRNLRILRMSSIENYTVIHRVLSKPDHPTG